MLILGTLAGEENLEVEMGGRWVGKCDEVRGEFEDQEIRSRILSSLLPPLMAQGTMEVACSVTFLVTAGLLDNL